MKKPYASMSYSDLLFVASAYKNEVVINAYRGNYPAMHIAMPADEARRLAAEMIAAADAIDDQEIAA